MRNRVGGAMVRGRNHGSGEDMGAVDGGGMRDREGGEGLEREMGNG